MTKGGFIADHTSTSEELSGRFATVWHGAWLVALGLSAVNVAPLASHAIPIGYALAAAAAPGAAGLLLAQRRTDAVQLALLCLWTLGAAFAVALSGGLAGPLGIWILTPLAAAAIAGGARRLAAAVALVTVGGALVALAQAAGRLPLAPPSQPWLSVFALATFGVALGSAMIVGDRRSSERAGELASANQTFEAILQSRAALTLDLAIDGAIRGAFGGAIEPLSIGPLPANFVGLGQDPSRLADALRAAWETGGAEISFPLAGAAERSVTAKLTGRGKGLVAIVQETTERDDREAALTQAASDAKAQNDGKSRFLANMSHELRTPLNAIVGFSDIMRGQMFGPLSAKYAEYAGLIHESGGHLLDLINDVLDLSKVEAQRYELARETFDAREAVSAALRLVRVQADSANIKLRGALPATPTPIHADRRAIKQIVLNLLSNALKFTPSGGQVTVIVRGEETELGIIVADNGVGISPQDLARMGRPYEQAGDAQQRAQGSGLGLSLVRAFAELHGGRMEIQSELGEGTVVSVRLPVVISPTQASEVGNGPVAEPALESVSLGENVVRFTPDRRSER